MDQIKKVELIIQLRNSALTLWGYLITVSLGITAYLGSQIKEVPTFAGLVFILLFSLFAVSNANALLTNFKSRLLIGEYNSEKDEKTIAEFVKLNSLDDKTIKINMIFHAIIDSCVVIMLALKIRWFREILTSIVL